MYNALKILPVNWNTLVKEKVYMISEKKETIDLRIFMCTLKTFKGFPIQYNNCCILTYDLNQFKRKLWFNHGVVINEYRHFDSAMSIYFAVIYEMQ